ncbi:MAG: HlyD family efflux transporter periplasmic adaptor subunit [Deltaproteobacteria bacterium]|nr:HlyD family efflux transporter periplasmic adaptor subunit [Deltaproteobacteria bacterium]
MPQFDINRPRRSLKSLGIMLASFVALVSVALLLVTHEPKKAESSPPPVKAAIVPQIADAKSEAEITFRGKSFSVFQRRLVMPYGGEILSIEIKEGQPVNENESLVKYKLDRQARIQVMGILYPAKVLDLKKVLYDQKIARDKIRNISMRLRQMELEKAEQDFDDIRNLQAKNLAEQEAVRNAERKLKTAQKKLMETKESLKQAEQGFSRTQEDLKFFEDKQKRDLDLLEYQTRRSYQDSDIPYDIAFLKAPITGQVLWLSPDLRVNAEVAAGFAAITIAPTNPMVVRCKVHELDLVKLKMGDRGTVVFDAIPDKKFGCKVSRIPWLSRNPALEVPADYEIECLLDNGDGKIKDGLTCNVRVSVAQ